jgi:uncharacterized protein (TIGR00251 family)
VLDLRETGEGVTIPVRVTPRGGRTVIEGVEAGALRLRLGAPPVEGAANRELLDFLAKSLRLPKRNLTLVQGERSRAKLVLVVGLTVDDIRQRLQPDS